MTRKLTGLFAAAAVVGGLATATAVLADEATPPQSPANSGMMDQHGATMGEHGGMMGMMGQMNPDQMKQMADNCNRMMESMNHSRTTPGKHETPTPRN